jgi:2-polyprenyl-3-methyl-5-hydroxy-6-metoxy-1,4-benzoquinol methylase
MLAMTLMESGRIDDAVAACHIGVANCPNAPDLPALHGLAADALIRLQRPKEAIVHLVAALELAPEIDVHWILLNRVLAFVSLPPETGRPILIKALAHSAIRPTSIAGAVAGTLCRDPFIAALVRQAKQGGLPSCEALSASLVRLAADELLLALMEAAVVPSPPLERLFTAIRRRLLQDIEVTGVPSAALPFCAALAVQAFHTDYAWFVTGEEDVLVDRLVARFDEALRVGDAQERLPSWLALIGAYRPLHRLECANLVAERPWPSSYAALLRIEITEPLEELVLRSQIQSLTPVSDPVSREVQAQYEENPYPRWVRTACTAGVPLPGFLRSIGAEVPADPSYLSPDVLIAGCGTGQHAIVSASFHENSKVLAIDLSRTSLAYAWRKTRELGIGNIEYRHGDITELKGFDRRFHVIECSGVLVCIDDPLAAWRILVEHLHPGGIMNIGLYSEIARRRVVMARDYIADKGYAATAADIRQCRQDILELPDTHPLASLRTWRDLYTISDCRDLLFHVKEHRFSIPQIKEALDELGLRFLRFGLKDADIAAYRRRFPDDPGMTSLDNWHVFEQEHPHTFSNMYQFWVQKG